MPDAGSYLDALLFAVIPYVALVIFFLKTIERYRQMGFSYSSLSSQFLENRQHFWAVVPFHFGIIVVLTGHVVAFLFPRSILLWNQVPLRLYILEVTALMFGLLTLVGLLGIVTRRLGHRKVLRVTSRLDWLVYGLLLLQVISGVWIALFHPWGSSWFASAMTPYLWSIAKLNPQIGPVAALPWVIKLHLLNMFALLAVFPFTRLVHILVIPNMYLWRRPQVVRWYQRVV